MTNPAVISPSTGPTCPIRPIEAQGDTRQFLIPAYAKV